MIQLTYSIAREVMTRKLVHMDLYLLMKVTDCSFFTLAASL
jgi:tRNA A37 threonylcarbamoyladenosine biosynthesis protein TsaE